METWRSIPGYSAYEASDTGLVRAIATGKLRHQSYPDRPTVHVLADGATRAKNLYVHRLVYAAFKGPVAGMRITRSLTALPPRPKRIRLTPAQQLVLYARRAHHHDDFEGDWALVRRMRLSTSTQTSYNLHLTVNHFVTMFNAWGKTALNRILFTTVPKEDRPALRVILLYLGMLDGPDVQLFCPTNYWIKTDEPHRRLEDDPALLTRLQRELPFYQNIAERLAAVS